MYIIVVNGTKLPPSDATIALVCAAAQIVSSICNCEVEVLSRRNYLLNTYVNGTPQPIAG